MSINTENESESNFRSIYEIIQAGDIAGVRDFIAKGDDINKVDKESGWTPLEIAAEVVIIMVQVNERFSEL